MKRKICFFPFRFLVTGAWAPAAAKGPLCSGCCAIRRGPCRCTACRHRPSMIKDSDRATRLPLWGLAYLNPPDLVILLGLCPKPARPLCPPRICCRKYPDPAGRLMTTYLPLPSRGAIRAYRLSIDTRLPLHANSGPASEDAC